MITLTSSIKARVECLTLVALLYVRILHFCLVELSLQLDLERVTKSFKLHYHSNNYGSQYIIEVNIFQQ